jgi:hypothetical protein
MPKDGDDRLAGSKLFIDFGKFPGIGPPTQRQ